jgi:hypothetical protein
LVRIPTPIQNDKYEIFTQCYRECKNYIEGEQREMTEIYRGKGMSEEDASMVVSILSKNKEHFVDVMMVEELGLLPPDPDDNIFKTGLWQSCFFLKYEIR